MTTPVEEFSEIFKNLYLPKKIATSKIALFIFNSVMFLILITSDMALMIMHSFSMLSLAIISVLGLLILAGLFFVELLIDNFILASALVTFLFGRRYVGLAKVN